MWISQHAEFMMAYAIYIYIYIFLDAGVRGNMMPHDVTIPRYVVRSQSFRGFALYIVPAMIFTTVFSIPSI